MPSRFPIHRPARRGAPPPRRNLRRSGRGAVLAGLALAGTLGTSAAALGGLVDPSPAAAFTTTGVNLPDDVWIADPYNHQIVVDPANDGIQSEFLGEVGVGFEYPQAVAVDRQGDFFVVDEAANQVDEFLANGTTPTLTGLDQPHGIAVDDAGDVFVADSGASQVLEYPAGGGAPIAVGTGLDYPEGVAVDARGDVFIADSSNNRVVEVPAGGGPQVTVASGLEFPEGVAVDPQGDVFIADTLASEVLEVVAGIGTPTQVASGFSYPGAVAVDENGTLLVADTGNGRVVDVDPTNPPQLLPIGGGFDEPTDVAVPPPVTRPGAPTGVTVVPGDAKAVVSFTPPVDTGASDGKGNITSYQVKAVDLTDRAAAQIRVVGPSSPITVPELRNGDRYAFTVTADNLAGSGAASVPVKAKVGQPPLLAGVPPEGTVGTPYNFTFSYGGAPAPTVTLASGTLPPGLTLGGNGPGIGGAGGIDVVLSGTPTTPGRYVFVLEAANGIGSVARLRVTMTIVS
jgi:sugar lactone lactonase YvrE